MVLERLVVTIANFVVFTVLARKLGPESTGIFSLTQSILLVGWPIALFINEQVLIRQTLDSTQNTNSIFKHALTYKVVLSAITKEYNVKIEQMDHAEYRDINDDRLVKIYACK